MKLKAYYETGIMAKTAFWEGMDAQVCADYIEASYGVHGATGARGMGNQAPPPEIGFVEWAKETIANAGFNADPERWKYWVSKFNPESKQSPDHQWMDGFPHSHNWDDGVTLVLMIKPAELGGETVILPNATDREKGRPEDWLSHRLTPGEAMLIGGRLWHGVRPIIKGERLALITTAYTGAEEWTLR